MNCCSSHGILLLLEKEYKETCLLYVSARHTKKALKALEEAKIPLFALSFHGLPSVLARYRHRVGIILGLALFFFSLFIAPKFIWELEIVGTERLSQAEVASILEKSGVYIGAYIPKIDRKSVYASILQNSADISWLSVNFRGSIATVEILEREAEDTACELTAGANIIANKDGRIVDMQITKGQRIAQNGMVVKEGDLLVSGVYDTARFGTRFVHAKADILAEVTDTYTVSIPLSVKETVYGTENVLRMDLLFLNNSINIFKNHSNLNNKYDIITRKEPLPAHFLQRLPLSLVRTVALPYTVHTKVLSESEALSEARKESEKLIGDAAYRELLASEEDFTVEDDCLVYTRRIYAVQDIAKTSIFTSE